MVTNVDILSARVVRIVFCECYRGLIVTVKSDRVVGEVECFGDELFEPNGFFGSVRCGNIFSFGG